MNTTTAVVGYDEFRAKIGEVKTVCNFLPDVSSDEGYTKSKRIALDVGKILTAVEKKRKELKADSLEYGRKIDSEAKGIVAELEAFQLPHKAAYQDLDRLKKDREERRRAELESRVEAMRSLPEVMADSDSSGVKAAMEGLSKEECLDFYEFTEQALKAINASKEALSIMFAAKLKQEAEAIELEELRKKQAEQAQKDRDERIAKEASEKADKEAAESKAAELKAIELAAEATRQKEAAEKQAKIDAEKAKTQMAEAEKQAKIDAANAAEEARKAQIAMQEEKEAAERKEIEKREASKKHVAATRKAAKEDIMRIGVDESTARDIVLAISYGKVSGVTINY